MDLILALDNVKAGRAIPAVKFAELLRRGQVEYSRGRAQLTQYGQTVLDTWKGGR